MSEEQDRITTAFNKHMRDKVISNEETIRRVFPQAKLIATICGICGATKVKRGRGFLCVSCAKDEYPDPDPAQRMCTECDEDLALVRISITNMDGELDALRELCKDCAKDEPGVNLGSGTFK